MSWNVLHGDCIEKMRELPDQSIDAVVTDPPYELGFMGKGWDASGIANSVEMWGEVLRLLKPGGHLLAFSGTRTYHRMVCAIEDAGFEIRDQIAWVFGSGFPKSLDVSKAIDKRKDWDALKALQTAIRDARKEAGISQSEAARRMGLIAEGESLGGGGFMWFETGQRVPTREQWPKLKAALGLGDEYDAAFKAAEREVLGEYDEDQMPGGFGDHRFSAVDREITAPISENGQKWQGWGTALKPAYEPIVVARKPLVGTVAQNVLTHGTGAINVDGCRVGTEEISAHGGGNNGAGRTYGMGTGIPAIEKGSNPHIGRWPANLVLDEEAGVLLDEQTGHLPSGVAGICSDGVGMFDMGGHEKWGGYGDSGGASRFFYCAKSSRAERNAGLDGFDPQATIRYGEQGQGPEPQQTPRRHVEQRNVHPTVKPIDLMRWLVRLVTPPDGAVLDPFNGSGSTGCAVVLEGFNYIGIDLEAEYVEIAKARIAWWEKHPEGIELSEGLKAERKRQSIAETGQDTLFGEAA